MSEGEGGFCCKEWVVRSVYLKSNSSFWGKKKLLKKIIKIPFGTVYIQKSIIKTFSI